MGRKRETTFRRDTWGVVWRRVAAVVLGAVGGFVGLFFLTGLAYATTTMAVAGLVTGAVLAVAAGGIPAFMLWRKSDEIDAQPHPW